MSLTLQSTRSDLHLPNGDECVVKKKKGLKTDIGATRTTVELTFGFILPSVIFGTVHVYWVVHFKYNYKIQ